MKFASANKSLDNFWSFLASCFKTVLEKRVSDQIDRQLKQDEKVYSATQNLLLYNGTSMSGKTTIYNQMRILYSNGFSDNEKLRKIEDIQTNICNAIITICRAMTTLSPPVGFELPENQARLDWIKNIAYTLDFDSQQEFYEHIESLLNDKGFQTTYKRSNEYHLTDNAKYFLDRIDVIKQHDYKPNEQDVLRCYASTWGIFVTHFKVDKTNFNIFDFGGQNYRRHLWRRYYDNLTGIIFVADISSYNTELHVDPAYTNLQESLRVFEGFICNNRVWKPHNKPLILLLNKQDLFAEKILGGVSKLEDYFAEFRTYQTPADALSDPDESPEVTRAKYFIRDQFLNLTKDKCCHCHCYPHFTCAIETENIRRVFSDCWDNIQHSFISEL